MSQLEEEPSRIILPTNVQSQQQQHQQFLNPGDQLRRLRIPRTGEKDPEYKANLILNNLAKTQSVIEVTIPNETGFEVFKDTYDARHQPVFQYGKTSQFQSKNSVKVGENIIHVASVYDVKKRSDFLPQSDIVLDNDGDDQTSLFVVIVLTTPTVDVSNGAKMFTSYKYVVTFTLEQLVDAMRESKLQDLIRINGRIIKSQRQETAPEKNDPIQEGEDDEPVAYVPKPLGKKEKASTVALPMFSANKHEKDHHNKPKKSHGKKEKQKEQLLLPPGYFDT